MIIIVLEKHSQKLHGQNIENASTITLNAEATYESAEVTKKKCEIFGALFYHITNKNMAVGSDKH